jgi:uncharacterized protein
VSPAPAAGVDKGRAARDPFIDALRAIALLGVLVVNALSYPASPAGSPLGMPSPADSPAALATFGLVAWWLQGKAYPLLTFLFGYSLALALRRPSAGIRSDRRRRMVRLLLLGVLHGALLYAGDILTMYALAGLILLGGPPAPLHRWIARWRLLAVLALAAFAGGLALALATVGMEFRVVPAYGDVPGVPDFVALNWGSYSGSLPGTVVLFLPEVLMLMSAGYIAGRLRWLTHERWQPARRAVARRVLPAALLLNLLYAALMTHAAAGKSSWQWVWLSASPLTGWMLSAAMAAALASWWSSARPALVHALAPLGRYSLSVYVGHSLLCACLFSGAGLGWALGSAGLVAYAAGLWGICWLLARWADRHGFHGPLEGWMIRA